MTIRYSRRTYFHDDTEKKKNLLLMSWPTTHSINNINTCTWKVLIQYDPTQHMHILSAHASHNITATCIATTSRSHNTIWHYQYHMTSVTYELHNHITTVCYKNFMIRHTYSDKNNLYIIQGLYVTHVEIKLSFPWFYEDNLSYEYAERYSLCKTHYPKWRTILGMDYSTNKKQKWLIRN
jgi:hypothetical protein